ncbi:thioesterase family protein [Mycobacterium sp. NPDC006124]|uniref:acyl-CoA thioesterase n=1 Tax=Mycobacterium sp. NPDC006124 TaxID=3156729 RepID=UPI0033A6E1AF
MSGTDADTPLVALAPRAHPARLVATNYPVRGSVEARYGDMDANGHLNNLALESLHENTRALLNARVMPGIYDRGQRRIRLVSATNVVHFLEEAFWPNTIGTGIGVGRLGRTSFVASTALFVGGDCVSLCDTVLVTLDENGPTPIPASARAQLEALTLSG